MTNTKDDNELFDDNGILKDGARLHTPMYAMDSVQKSIATHHHPSLSKPGYRFVTDAEAKQRIDDAHAAYREDLSNRWRTHDQGEGDSCTAPDGTSGKLQFVAGRLKCVPEAAAKTADSKKLLDAEFDMNDGDLRELSYRLYDESISNRWKGED